MDSRALEQVKILDQVLVAKNDNDPRLDRELKVLGPVAKAAFRERYETIPAEQRNERGTIVFLVGRNLERPEDFEFLGKVLAEPACRSLANCGRDETSQPDSADMHLDAGVEVTLAYPQLVALRSLDNLLSAPDGDPKLRAQALREVENSRKSPTTRVAQAAHELLKKYKN
jgi:hypothetical protein